jgi:hypothetical protein
MRMRLDGAMAKAAQFLLAQQAGAGFWADWRLPPGESRMWTTAYVGYRLGSVAGSVNGAVHEGLRQAADWLLDHQLPDGGWGYNEETGVDADSTALAILFLTAQGRAIPAQALKRLQTFHGEDGGYSTYTSRESFGSWTVSHPDVTALAVMAGLRHGELAEAARRGLVYASAQRTPEGLWNSFWWDSNLYSSEANLRLWRLAGLQTDDVAFARIRPGNAFETALLILCYVHAGLESDPAALELTAGLLSAQHPDGAWKSAPILRLTDRRCYDPWNSDDAGPLFEDEQHVFTSATALAALGAMARSWHS